jgi:hypothetical protein
MTSNAVELRPRTIGEVIGLTLSLYRKHFLSFLGIAAVVAVPGLILASLSNLIPAAQAALAPEAFIDPSADLGAVAGVVGLLSFGALCVSVLALVYGIFWPLMEGALVHSTIERMLGRAPSLGASYGEARKHWGPLWGSNILAQLGIFAALFAAYVMLAFGLGIAAAAGMSQGDGAAGTLAVGLSLLCLPVLLIGVVIAIVLSINWVFRAPAVMGESIDSIQALRRSTAIARGDRWRLFGRYVLLFAVEFVVLALPALLVLAIVGIGAVIAPSRTPEEALRALVPTIIGGTVLSVALTFVGMLLLVPLRAIFTVVNYFDMRIRKENLELTLAQPAPVAEAPAAPPATVQPATAVVVTAPPTRAVAPVVGIYTPAPMDLSTLSPGQRVGVLFTRVRTEGDNPQTLNDLGMAFAAVGDSSGALDTLARARRLAPHDPDIAFNMAQVHLSRKEDDAAREMLQEYLRLETNPEDAARVREDPRFQRLLS